MNAARIDEVEAELRREPRTFLVTGGAGFIGSHIVERLLWLGQRVRLLDDFSTGHRRNIAGAIEAAGGDAASRLEVIEGDIRDADACRRACAGAQIVLHQAALGAIPRSLANPVLTTSVNVDGWVTVAAAAREAGVERMVYASSSSVYGDDQSLPKVEDRTGRPLSPYGASKQADEAYAAAFRKAFGMAIVGLRYFNVFGERQDPNGPYAAVIPKWIDALATGQPCEIHGDGQTTRDFSYVANAVQANLLAATGPKERLSEIYNVAYGEGTTLETLFELIRARVATKRPEAARAEPRRGPFRPSDIRHSQADVGRAKRELGYAPRFDVAAGLDRTVEWFLAKAG